MSTTNASRVPSVVGDDGQVKSVQVTPFRKQQFTGKQLATPDDVARQLNQMQDSLQSATHAARSNPHNQHVLFVDKTVTASADDVYRFPHGLGRKVQWTVARWRNSTVGNGMYEPANGQADRNVLVLKSSQAGIVDIEVW